MSANSKRGEVEVYIGNKTRLVRFRTNQIAQLEDLSGKGIMKLMDEDSVGIRLLRDALFVGLLHESKKLTPNKVGSWLDDFDGDLADLVTEVFTALAESIPGGHSMVVDSEDEDDEGKSTGLSSSEEQPKQD
jgi:hypothetical protein